LAVGGGLHFQRFAGYLSRGRVAVVVFEAEIVGADHAAEGGLHQIAGRADASHQIGDRGAGVVGERLLAVPLPPMGIFTGVPFVWDVP
jgi:hypothetical protein